MVTMNANILSLKNITYTYPLNDQPSLTNFSYDFKSGKIYGIIGGNGTGKTTLGRIIRGFAPGFYKGDLKGKVILHGQNLATFSQGELCVKIGYVLQNPFSQITGIKDSVFEEIAFGLENLGVEPDEIIKRVSDAIIMIGIEDLAYQNPAVLSGGQLQKVAIASVLVLDPCILFFDEPTSQLDNQSSIAVVEIIQRLKQAGKTVIWTSNKIELLADNCDVILALDKGRLYASDAGNNLLQSPALTAIGVRLPLIYQLQSLLNSQSKIAFKSQSLTFDTDILASKVKELFQSRLNSLNAEFIKKIPKLPGPDKLIAKDTQPIISLQNVSYCYNNGNSALLNINLNIKPGAKMAIMGNNGAGKTTLAKLMNGLLRPTSGAIFINGRPTDTQTVAQLSQQIAYVFQNPDDQIFKPTVQEEIEFGLKMRKLKPQEREIRIQKALEMTQLVDFRNSNPYDLPLPRRKMIAIASIIALDSEVVIFDEPGAGQDPVHEKLLAAILDELNAAGKTILVISHDIEFVARNFTDLCILADHQIIKVGQISEVCEFLVAQADAEKKVACDLPFAYKFARQIGLQGFYLDLETLVYDLCN